MLNEILAVRLIVMDEPVLYDLIQVVHRWWAPRPFPEPVTVAMASIVDKLVAGLVFRARGGQRSEVLLQRLKQAINNEELYKHRILEIIRREAGLSGEIQDWIRGMERGTSKPRSSSALSAVGAGSFVQQLAELFRLTLDGSESASNVCGSNWTIPEDGWPLATTAPYVRMRTKSGQGSLSPVEAKRVPTLTCVTDILVP